MTIKQHGGIFGRNPTFNNGTVGGTLTVDQIVEKTGAAGITLDGVTLKDGNVVLADGKGIDFSATAGTGTSELFDDYEEGTFGVTLTDDGSSTISVSYNICNYVKIGRLVYFTGEVRISGITGTPGGDIKMNLPFFPASGSERSQRTRVFYHLSSLTGSPTGVGSGFIDNTDATMLLQIESNFSIAAISSNIQVGTTFMFSVTYQAAD